MGCRLAVSILMLAPLMRVQSAWRGSLWPLAAPVTYIYILPRLLALLLSGGHTHGDDILFCIAVDAFQEGFGQTTEAFKKNQKATAELAEAQEQLAETSTALKQVRQEAKVLRQKQVSLFPNAML